MSAGNGNKAIEREDTPRSGIDLRMLSELTPSEGVVYLAEQLKELREEMQRGGAVVGRAAAHADRAEIHGARAVELGETAVSLAQQTRADVLAEVDQVRVAVMVHGSRDKARWDELRALIGDAPVIIDPRESRSGQHTPEELTAMEQGTGLAGTLGRVSAQVSRLSATRVALVGGLGGALGTGLATALPDIIRAVIAALT